jgi:hypothetical protein
MQNFRKQFGFLLIRFINLIFYSFRNGIFELFFLPLIVLILLQNGFVLGGLEPNFLQNSLKPLSFKALDSTLITSVSLLYIRFACGQLGSLLVNFLAFFHALIRDKIYLGNCLRFILLY